VFENPKLVLLGSAVELIQNCNVKPGYTILENLGPPPAYTDATAYQADE
jgi:hypothetical protein